MFMMFSKLCFRVAVEFVVLSEMHVQTSPKSNELQHEQLSSDEIYVRLYYSLVMVMVYCFI